MQNQKKLQVIKFNPSCFRAHRIEKWIWPVSAFLASKAASSTSNKEERNSNSCYNNRTRLVSGSGIRHETEFRWKGIAGDGNIPYSSSTATDPYPSWFEWICGWWNIMSSMVFTVVAMWRTSRRRELFRHRLIFVVVADYSMYLPFYLRFIML